LWGPKNFEECLAADMKGRPPQQTSIVTNACRKKFPALPSFTKNTKVGTLFCVSANVKDFELQLTQTSIGNFTIKRRTSEFISAENTEEVFSESWGKGASMILYFEHGTGTVRSLKNNNSYWSFSCDEK
jgi:hypothetical protein